MIETLTTNTSTSTVTRTDRVHLHASGTFGSGTITLEQQLSDGSWVAIAGAAYTAATDDIIQLGKSSYNLRVTLTGATSPNIKVELR